MINIQTLPSEERAFMTDLMTRALKQPTSLKYEEAELLREWFSEDVDEDGILEFILADCLFSVQIIQ
jgi:hypothetical protein